jgi:multicomponent Na+:H+ antiporter subunit F
MTEFLFAAAGFLLLMVAAGLFRLLSGPTPTDRIMTAQLAGSGGVGVLLLLAVATEAPPVLDVALMLALLAAFAAVAFVCGASASSARGGR